MCSQCFLIVLVSTVVHLQSEEFVKAEKALGIHVLQALVRSLIQRENFKTAWVLESV